MTTAAQRMASMRARRKAQGLVKVEVWVPEEYRKMVGAWVALKVTKEKWNEAKAKEPGGVT